MHYRRTSKRLPLRTAAIVAVFVLCFALVGVFRDPLAATAVSTANATLYAAEVGRGSANCSAWANACPLSTALNQAASGDEIWVEAGIHYPTTSSTDITATLQLNNGIALYGGFDGSETARSQRDWAQNLTVLSGDIEANDSVNGDGILTDPENISGLNSYHVLTAVDISETAVVDGFTITAGHASNGDPGDSVLHNRGGGLHNHNSIVQVSNTHFIGNQASFAGGAIHNANSTLSLENVRLENNTAIEQGGGMNNDQFSDITINNSTFLNNATGVLDNMAEGGAIYHTHSEMTVSNTRFEGNASVHHGGAIYHFSSQATYTSVEFINNTAVNGGGVYNRSAHPTFNQTIFQGNEASEYGGAMYNYFNSDPILNNTLLAGNFAEDGAAAIFNFFNSDPILNNVTVSGNLSNGATAGLSSLQNSNPVILNSIFWNNRDSSGTGTLAASINSSSATIEHSIVQGSGGSSSWNSQAGFDLGGNLDQNPHFVSQTNPATAPSTAGDFGLTAVSPAINAGDTAGYGEISGSGVDLAGNGRIFNTFIDIGAYEFIGTPSSFALSIEIVGSGSGQLTLNGAPLTCSGSCTVDFDPDTAVTLTATPNGQSTFSGWDGDCTGMGSCQLTMNAPKSVTVRFIDSQDPVSYPLTLNLIGSGSGQLFLDGAPLSCSGGCTVDILEQTAVTLTATPHSDSTFVGWGGACHGDGSCNIVIDSAKTVTVDFHKNSAPVSHPLSIELSGSGNGQLFLNGAPIVCSSSCKIDFAEQTAVTLTVTPNPNSLFMGWGGACQGQDVCNIIMDSAKTVIVNLVENEDPSDITYSLYLPLIIRP